MVKFSRSRTFVVTVLLATLMIIGNLISRPAVADIIDGVVATVDEQPILLSELNKLLSSSLTMVQASSNSSARAALDKLIFDTLLNNEAESRHITVVDGDIERYVDEVANRNSMSREGFVEALKAQGKDWRTYREQVRSDILQTKLASVMLQGMSTVSDEELQTYLSEHPEQLQQGASVTLMHIVTSNKETAQQFSGREYAPSEFAEVAKSHSLAPDAAEGGMLGKVAERDLSPEVFATLLQTKPGHSSTVIEEADGNTSAVYYIVERTTGTAEEQAATRERIKRDLSQAKLAQRMEGMFQTELYKNHIIDKKI